MCQKFAIVAALCLGLMGCGHAPHSSGPSGEVRAIEQVVETFRAAILNKDKPAYMRLFFSDQAQAIGWQAVVDDAKLAQIQRERPQAIKARPIPTNNFIALIDSVLASPTLEEERITNLKVDTDGEIATASFDYAYLSDGKLSNWGKEQWLLVRTEQGWKIFSVVYTIRDPRP
jgi:ketosteroid isomerase-like protein